MVRTHTSETTSTLAACQRPCRAPIQEVHNLESKSEVVMEGVESDDTARDRLVPGDPIRGANTAMDEEDAKLVYNRTRFWRDKVKHRYFRYYHGRRIIVERGAIKEKFDKRAPKVHAVLDAQGWTDMVKDHCPETKEIVWEFYANLHQRHGDSFCTWLRGMRIKVTPSLISTIAGVPRVRDLTYPYPVDHLPTCANMIAYFVERHPHQMELDGEGNFQMSDFNNDIHCIYHILASRVPKFDRRKNNTRNSTNRFKIKWCASARSNPQRIGFCVKLI